MSQQHRVSSSSDPALEITRSILTEAAQRPWLAALLMRRRPDWLTRLTQLAQWLRNLPRHTRRVFRRKLAYGLAAATLLLALAGTPTAYATGSMTVVSGAAGLVTDSKCSLAEAIVNANNSNSTTWPDCAGASTGGNTITLPASDTLSYATALSGDGYSALPDITNQITIEANGSTIQRSGASTNFRILNVALAGNLTLNQATISGGNSFAGGILEYGTLTVQNSTISGNNGGIFNNGGTLKVQNSTISGNVSTNQGGGIYNNGTVTVQNSTISGNSATVGGGIRSYNGTLVVQNSTISSNTASVGYGGGISTRNAAVTVQNSVVALQTSGADCYYYGTAITSQGYNIESAATCNFIQASDQRNVNSGSLNLQPLGPFAGDSKPHPATRALGAGSVAIDKIPIGTNGCATTNTSDERGGVRAGQVIAGDHRGGLLCDVGAFEFDSTQTPTAVTLRDLAATANTSSGVIGAAFAALAALGALLIGRRRLKLR